MRRRLLFILLGVALLLPLVALSNRVSAGSVTTGEPSLQQVVEVQPTPVTGPCVQCGKCQIGFSPCCATHCMVGPCPPGAFHNDDCH